MNMIHSSSLCICKSYLDILGTRIIVDDVYFVFNVSISKLPV